MSYATSIDSLLSASPTGDYKSIFSTFSPTTPGASVYNANLWGGGGATLDWTGICWYDDGDGFDTIANPVAITKRHVIITDHGGAHVPFHGTWIKHDGTLVTRQFLDAITNIGDPTNDPASTSSLRVLYLDADLPAGIATYPILGELIPYASLTPLIKSDNENKALITEGGESVAFIFGAQPADQTRQLYYEDSISGDSGSPVFFLNGTQLIYATSLVFGGGGSGPSVRALLSDVLAACAAMDARNANTGYLPVVFDSAGASASIGIGIAIGI